MWHLHKDKKLWHQEVDGCAIETMLYMGRALLEVGTPTSDKTRLLLDASSGLPKEQEDRREKRKERREKKAKWEENETSCGCNSCNENFWRFRFSLGIIKHRVMSLGDGLSIQTSRHVFNTRWQFFSQLARGVCRKKKRSTKERNQLNGPYRNLKYRLEHTCPLTWATY